MSKRTQFVVTEIVTQSDGRVTLNGPAGSLDIHRGEHGSTLQLWRSEFLQTVEEDKEYNCHRVTISALPAFNHKTVGSGTSF